MESGQCGCLDYDLDNGDDYLYISEVLGLTETLGEFDDNTHRRVIHTICTRTLSEGDHLQVQTVLANFCHFPVKIKKAFYPLFVAVEAYVELFRSLNDL